MDHFEELKNAVAYIQGEISETPLIGLVIHEALLDSFTPILTIDYKDLPNSPIQEGSLILTKIENKSVIIDAGYRSNDQLEITTFPIRIMQLLGVKKLILTDNALAISKLVQEREIVFIKDHINLLCDNPLIGKNKEALGTRFPDMSEAYSPQLLEIGKDIANTLNLDVASGIHATIKTMPPDFTKIETMQMVGIDTISRAIAPQTIVAAHGNMEVLAIATVATIRIDLFKELLTQIIAKI